MIGDLILWFAQFKRQLCCKHDYKRNPFWTEMYGDPYVHYTCAKCGRKIKR